jgi:heptosyltransferase-2
MVLPIKILRWVDKYIVWLLVVLLFWLKYIFFYKKNEIISHPKKILVIRLWALGSSLLTFPMIKQLQDHYGTPIEYDLLATSRNIWVFKHQGYFQTLYNLFSIKDLFRLLVNFKKYDIVIDAEEYFQISSLMWLLLGKVTLWYSNIYSRGLSYVFPVKYSELTHNVMNCLSLLSPLWISVFEPKHLEPLCYQQKHKINVDLFLKPFRNKKFICIHALWAETSPDRFWSDTHWVSLIEQINKRYWSSVVILLSGTPSELRWIDGIVHKLSPAARKEVHLFCRPLFEFAYLLQNCDLMISNDTGPMHLAAAMGTKTIGLFGPNLPQIFGPWPLDTNIWLYKGKWTIYIKPHLWIFEKDPDNCINIIHPSDVLKFIV